MIFYTIIWVVWIANSVSWNPFRGFNIKLQKTRLDAQVNIDTSSLPSHKLSIIKNFKGFYGMLGPDIDEESVETLFDLFTGDGIIHGVFLDKGELTFVRHLIQTEKIRHELIFGKFSKIPILMLFSMWLHKCGIIPNPMGVANTAFMRTSTRTFAMFERDLPYELYLDFDKKTIKTLGKLKTPLMQYFSGHSRFENDRIKTISYKILDKCVEYREFDEDLILKRSRNYWTKYLPIIHDFISTESNTVLFADSPFIYSGLNKIPVSFDKNQTTIFHVEKRNIRYQIDTNESFYIFHYGQVRENITSIEFYASTYKDIDFSKINISGKYCKFRICLKTGTMEISNNPALDDYNLDFPVHCGKYTILRNLDIKHRRINGFVICDGLELCDVLLFENRKFCGEPAIIVSETGEKYMVGFYYENGEYYFIMVRVLENGMFDRDYIELLIPEKVGIGFHSTAIM
jgi:carotenoid cleavage dioxygenase-like enzyme